MKRREFLETTGKVALYGGALMTYGVSGCTSTQWAAYTTSGSTIVVKKESFAGRSFVMVDAGLAAGPLLIHEYETGQYSAVVMKCTHKGCGLDQVGDMLECRCHGSEFSMQGNVLKGPADRDLQSLKVRADNENIYVEPA